jgi:hydrogenase/urease accessory protein HupE
MPGRLAAAIAVIVFAALVLPRPAFAHLMPARQGTLEIVDRHVFAVLSVPVSALHGFDDDGDGMMSDAELQAHRDALRAEIDRRFAIRDGASTGKVERLDLVLAAQNEPPQDEAEAVVALERVAFAAPPSDLRVACDLFPANGPDRGLALTATRHPAGKETETEAAILTPLSTKHRFFRPGWAAFADWVKAGVEHVLTGFDHLLFLLTIVVAGTGWAYWLGVTTTFTLAHSITLAASVYGAVRLRPSIVEPLIALSIVGVAIDNLARQGRVRASQRLPVVFGCGLVHGLGFGASFEALGLDDAHRLGGLAGFNLGIEIGQALFLCAALAAIRVATLVAPALTPERSARWISILAGLLGGFWLVERLVG